jgi:hypothetical protein
MTTTHIEVLAANGTQEVKTGQLLEVMEEGKRHFIARCHIEGWSVKVDKVTGKAVAVYGLTSRFSPSKRPALFNI